MTRWWGWRRACAELSLVFAIMAMAALVLAANFLELPELWVVGCLGLAPLAIGLGGIGSGLSGDGTGAGLTAKLGLVLGTLALISSCVVGVEMQREAPIRGPVFLNHFKQVALALHSYESAHGKLPPAVVRDAQGKPLYSWRVLILPYMEEPELAREFHLDEPWDSPRNKPLLERMPYAYRRPGDDSFREGRTSMEVVSGPGTAFEDPGQPFANPMGGSNFPDGLGDTILVVETEATVPWTAPTEIKMDSGRVIPPLGGGFTESRPLFRFKPKPAKFFAAMADGSVRRIPRSLTEKQLRSLFTRNGGEPSVLPSLP